MPGLWDGSDYQDDQFHDASELFRDAAAHAQATGIFDEPVTAADVRELSCRDWQQINETRTA